jgi:hypothetical protein
MTSHDTKTFLVSDERNKGDNVNPYYSPAKTDYGKWVRGSCRGCGKRTLATISFIDRYQVGLVAPTCTCGTTEPYFVATLRDSSIFNTVLELGETP